MQWGCRHNCISYSARYAIRRSTRCYPERHPKDLHRFFLILGLGDSSATVEIVDVAVELSATSWHHFSKTNALPESNLLNPVISEAMVI
jgi:hypothetical protein